jgi:LacI family transcriptional regulator
MKRLEGRATMTDVAKLAGVSQTTVSFVLNNVSGANISAETRAKVMSAVKDLGYRGYSTFYNLNDSQTHLIGFLTDEIGTSPFGGETLKGAQEAAWASNKMLVLINTAGLKKVEEEAIDALIKRQVEGIVYAAMFTRRVIPPKILHTIPTVLMNCYDSEHKFSSVTPNEIEGGKTATDTLIKSGRKRIALINGEPWMDAARDRLTGYMKSLEKHRITPDPSLIRFGNWRSDSGYDHTMSLMQLNSPPTAIFCGNDLVAIGAYEALKELGKKIPEDVSVIGYDNQEHLAVYMRPSLSTIALPHYEMGQWAMNTLLERISRCNQSPIIQEKLTCPYILRESIDVRFSQANTEEVVTKEKKNPI